VVAVVAGCNAMRSCQSDMLPSNAIVRRIIPMIALCFVAQLSCTPDRPAPRTAPAHQTTPAPRTAPAHQITQISVINALMIGRYDGVMPIPELIRYGDFGIGTLDHLDGEFILLEGRAYQVRGDGAVVEVGADRSTPFAVVTPFEQDGEFVCPVITHLSELDTKLNEALPQKNRFVAIRVDGRFSSITLRSVHRQEPPYRPLAEVAKSQSVWTRTNVAGTLVGIRCPAWVKGLNVPGYHWHFLADNHQTGGHVLDCNIVEGRVRHDVCRDWVIKLDDSAELNAVNLGEDLSQDLKRVESSRGEKASQ
jgi:acetolactate decarboxylase